MSIFECCNYEAATLSLESAASKPSRSDEEAQPPSYCRARTVTYSLPLVNDMFMLCEPACDSDDHTHAFRQWNLWAKEQKPTSRTSMA